MLTYPRTDSRYLTEDIVPTLKERLIASKGGYFDDVIDQILANPIKKQNHFVNNKKVSDHHAIIPTEQPVMLGAFSDSEFKIYDLVLKNQRQTIEEMKENAKLLAKKNSTGDICNIVMNEIL